MVKFNFLCTRLLSVCLKLQTLKDSCSGIFRTQTYPPNIAWFNAAAAICQEAIDWMEEVLIIFTKPENQTGSDQDNDRCEA
jgi:hypothetical protein